jgi:hypothetical protein
MENYQENLYDEDAPLDDPADGLDRIVEEDDRLLDHEEPTEELIEAILEYGGPEALSDAELHRGLP